MKRNFNVKQKGLPIKIIDENDKWLTCVTYVKYYLRSGKISMTNNFVYNGSSVHIGLFNDKRGRLSLINNKLQRISDDEIRRKVKELLRVNPLLSSNEIANKTGFSKYKLNRIYMTVKRKLC